MYIERLHVRNLRLLAEQEFSFLGPDGQPRMWTVIVGENGVCKSTILQAIALAALGPKLATAVAQDAQQFRSIASPDAAEINATFQTRLEENPFQVSLRIPPGRFDVVGLNEGAFRLDEIRGFRQPGWFVAGYGVGRFLAEPGEVAVPRDPVVDRVTGMFDLRHKMLGINFYEILPRPAEFVDCLEEVLGKEPEYKLLPDLTSLSYWLRGRDLSPVMASLRGGKEIPVQWLADGYKTMLAWISDLLGHAFLEQDRVAPANLKGTVLLDEIDLHLHPTWQRRIVPILKRAFPKLQFIVTTHSPLVLAGFEKEEIIRLRFQDGLVVQDPAGIEPGVLTASELLTNFFEVPRAGRPDLVQKERRYLELKALSSRDATQEEELKALEAELQPYWSSRPEPEKKPLSPQELVGSELP